MTTKIAFLGLGAIPALATALRERDKRLKTIDTKLGIAIVLPDRDALKAALELRSADVPDNPALRFSRRSTASLFP